MKLVVKYNSFKYTENEKKSQPNKAENEEFEIFQDFYLVYLV